MYHFAKFTECVAYKVISMTVIMKKQPQYFLQKWIPVVVVNLTYHWKDFNKQSHACLIPNSCFCVKICANVQRKPLSADAARH